MMPARRERGWARAESRLELAERGREGVTARSGVCAREGLSIRATPQRVLGVPDGEDSAKYAAFEGGARVGACVGARVGTCVAGGACDDEDERVDQVADHGPELVQEVGDRRVDVTLPVGRREYEAVRDLRVGLGLG